MSNQYLSYLEEINARLLSIDFYLEELLSLENRLQEVVARNTIVHIAAKTEVHQMIVGKTENKLLIVKKEMEALQKQFSKKDIRDNDEKLKVLMKKADKLKEEILIMEKELTEVKFHCNEFIDQMMKGG